MKGRNTFRVTTQIYAKKIAPLQFQLELGNITVATDQQTLISWLLRVHLHLHFQSLFHQTGFSKSEND